MNFNASSKPEYSLNESLIIEMINLYGILTKFLVVEKINRDDTVFGDYSHLKSNSNEVHDIHMLPEMSEEWESGGFNFSEFGMLNLDNVNLFAASSHFEGIIEMKSIVGNLIVFPNNKIMEITDINWQVPGINNLYTYNDAKSVYKLTCKPYDAKLVSELAPMDISADDTPYETLDNYFQELIDENTIQDTEAEVTPQVTTVQRGSEVDTKIQKPIIDKTEDDVFGNF